LLESSPETLLEFGLSDSDWLVKESDEGNEIAPLPKRHRNKLIKIGGESSARGAFS
jgi:hypothetical protein